AAAAILSQDCHQPPPHQPDQPPSPIRGGYRLDGWCSGPQSPSSPGPGEFRELAWVHRADIWPVSVARQAVNMQMLASVIYNTFKTFTAEIAEGRGAC